MRKDGITIEWDHIGAAFAGEDADKQALFLKGFAEELMDYDTHYSREMQMASVNEKLDKKTKDTLRKYLPALFHEEEE